MIIKQEMKNIDFEFDTDALTMSDMRDAIARIRLVEQRLFVVRQAIETELDAKMFHYDPAGIENDPGLEDYDDFMKENFSEDSSEETTDSFTKAEETTDSSTTDSFTQPAAEPRDGVGTD